LIVVLLILLFVSPAWADYVSVISADGPSSWWKLDAPSGTTATDTGTPTLGHVTNNATYSGGFTLGQTGIAGAPTHTATAFVTNGIAKTGNASDYNPNTINARGTTVELWVKPNAQADATLSSFGNSSSTYAWDIFLDNTGSKFEAVLYQSASSCGGSTFGDIQGGSYSAGNWYYVVLTTAGNGSTISHMILYVNASLIQDLTSFTGSVCSTTGQFTMAERHDSIFPLNGTEAMVAYYSTGTDGTGTGALNSTQVTNHYQAGISAPSGGLMVSPVNWTPKLFGPKPLEVKAETFGNEGYPLASGQYDALPKLKRPVYRGMYVD